MRRSAFLSCCSSAAPFSWRQKHPPSTHIMTPHVWTFTLNTLNNLLRNNRMVAHWLLKVQSQHCQNHPDLKKQASKQVSKSLRQMKETTLADNISFVFHRLGSNAFFDFAFHSSQFAVPGFPWSWSLAKSNAHHDFDCKCGKTPYGPVQKVTGGCLFLPFRIPSGEVCYVWMVLPPLPGGSQKFALSSSKLYSWVAYNRCCVAKTVLNSFW